MLKIKHYVLVSLIFLLVGCGSSSGGSGSTSSSSSGGQSNGISVGFKDSGATSADQTEYLITKKNIMEGNISALGTGIEQLGWNFFYNVGKTLFVTTYKDDKTTSYIMNEQGEVVEKATFFFDEQLVMFGNIGDHTMIAADAPSDGTHSKRKLYTVDVATGHITEKVSFSIFDDDNGTAGAGSVGWATALKVRGDKLYIPFHKLDDKGWYGTPDADKAFVAIYDYPLTEDATPKKIIEDNRTCNIGVNGAISSMIEADDGALYTYSDGTIAAGFSPASTKPSGILRIKSGETEFDQSYFFDITAETNSSLFWFDYVGNNKALGRILTSHDGNDTAWSAFAKNNFNHKLVIIDLANQTVTDVANVPLHQKRYTSPLTVKDGKVYVSIEMENDAFVYQVDIETATATRGAKIIGKTIKGFYDLNPTD